MSEIGSRAAAGPEGVIASETRIRLIAGSMRARARCAAVGPAGSSQASTLAQVRLIIVRHAKAAPGSSDASRPLAPKGRRAAASLARELRSSKPDAVISSPLLRAVETAIPIAEAAGVGVEIDARLAPGATADDLRAAVAGHGETVVTVGHQPDCSVIVFELTGRDVEFPTAGFYEVEL